MPSASETPESRSPNSIPALSSPKGLSTDSFDHVPHEVILIIAELLEISDLNSWIQTSRFFANLLDPSLYDLALTSKIYDEEWGTVAVIEWASIHGKNSVLKKLLEKGADISITGPDGRNLLHNAVEFGHVIAAQMLLDAGIDPSIPRVNGGNALHQAIYLGHEEITRSILIAGCDPNLVGADGMTPLYCAAYQGYPGIAQIILDAGAGADVPATHVQYGQTPLHAAAENGHDSVIEVLIKGGVDFNEVNNHGATPLCLAVESGHFPVVKALAQHTVDFDMKDGVTGSALHLAIRKEQRDTIELLLSSGADPLQLDGYGMSCMDRASTQEHIFELLKPYCRKLYEPVDKNTSLTAVRKTIAYLAKLLQGVTPYTHHNYFNLLAKSLLFVNDISEARTAVALHLASAFNGNYVCDNCEEGGEYRCDICSQEVDGDCYLCRRCLDVDICSSCYTSSEGSPEVLLCRGHEFACITLPALETYLFEESDVVNAHGESREQWLMRLVDLYGADSKHIEGA